MFQQPAKKNMKQLNTFKQISRKKVEKKIDSLTSALFGETFGVRVNTKPRSELHLEVFLYEKMPILICWLVG